MACDTTSERSPQNLPLADYISFYSIRRVKCHEQRPACHQCSSTGRQCDGYPEPQIRSSTSVTLVKLPKQSSLDLSSCPDGDLSFTLCELLAFHFFRLVLARSSYINFGSADQRSWTTLVLQASQSDEAIKNLVIAVSTLDMRERRRFSVEKADEAFVVHYGRALKLLVHYRRPDVGVVLIACLLCVICDAYNDNWVGVKRHIAAGKKITNDCDVRRNETMKELGDIVDRLERRLTEPGWNFLSWKVQWPLDHDTGAPKPRTNGVRSTWAEQKTLIAEGFISLSAASQALQNLVPTCLNRRGSSSPPSNLPPQRDDNVRRRLDSWLQHFTNLTTTLTSTEQIQLHTEITILTATHTCLRLMLQPDPSHPDPASTLLTQQSTQLSQTITTLTALPLPLQPNDHLLPPLFFATTHPLLVLLLPPSQHATALTKLRNHSWSGTRLATIAEQVHKLQNRTRPPVSVRVVDLAFSASASAAPREGGRGEGDGGGKEGAMCILSYTRARSDGREGDGDVHVFRWEGMPRDEAVQESVRALVRRVMAFEGVAFEDEV